MRYRETTEAPDARGYVAPTTDEFVELTVGMTLLIGFVLLAGGVYGRQRWLSFWGGLTLLACAAYYGRHWLA